MTVSLVNHGDTVAFMIHPRLTRGKGGEDVVPVFWSDNYFSLLPGEKKSVTVRFDNSSLAGTTPRLVRSEEHTSELQSRGHLVCRLLLEKKKEITSLV